MGKVVSSSAVVVALRNPAPPAADSRAEGAALAQLLAGYRRVLCAIVPDAGGRQILQRVAGAAAGRDCRLGIVSAAPFALPIEASACLFPTPLDRRARLIVARQRELDQLVLELGLREAEVFATAGVPSAAIRDVARLWQADLVLFARAADTGLRQRRARPGGFDAVALDGDGRIARPTFIERLFGG